MQPSIWPCIFISSLLGNLSGQFISQLCLLMEVLHAAEVPGIHEEPYQQHEEQEEESYKYQILRQCFQRLDLDQSGCIELNELRFIAKQITPQQNLADATDILRFADHDGDKKVSWQEFMAVMQPLAESMTDDEFHQHVNTLLGPKPHEAFNEPGYSHPSGNRAWLQEEVVPTLRQGIAHLVEQVMDQQLHLAAGRDWQDGPQDGEGGEPGAKYLPHDWRPFSPLRWLGEWLLQQLPPASPQSTHPSAETPLPGFHALTRQGKMVLAFKHLDRDGSGYLDTQELLSVAGKLHMDQDLQYAQELLHNMDLDKNGQVELSEYCSFVTALTEVLTDAEFDSVIHKVLGSSHYSYCVTRPDKLAFLFHEVQQERSSTLAFEEVVQLAHRMDPSATPWKIQATLEQLQLGEGGRLDVEQFIAGLSKVLTTSTDEELDQMVVSIVEGRKLGVTYHQNDPLDDVEPIKYREMLKDIPMPEHVIQISTMEVVDVVDGGGRLPLLLVDVRTEEEVSVSSLPGAVHLPVTENPDEPLGWVLGDLEPLRRQVAEYLTQGSRLPKLVAYCNTGARSAPASVLLSKTLGIAVRSMCGGIISYYNHGGRVKDPQGLEVQAIHPGSADLKPFVIRPSNFKFAA